MKRVIAEIKFWWYWLTNTDVAGRLTIRGEDGRAQIIYATDEDRNCIRSFWI